MTPANISLLVLAAIGVLATVWMSALASVGRGRNARDLCGRCAKELPPDSRYRIEGTVYCSRCTAVLKFRMTAAYLTLALLVVLSGLFGIAGAFYLYSDDERGWWLAPVVMGGSALFLFLGGRTVLRAMRDRNRFAEELARARLKAATFLGYTDDSKPGA